MSFRKISHNVDICVIGGGMAGLCAALSAARHGASVVLMHDRPVLGGNASSECRVHICGADRHNSIKNMRETGILEELRMENLYRNPNRNFSLWDMILFETLMGESNITMLLNCSCLDARMTSDTITSATGWQLTTQTYHKIEAKIFADCSGDGILAPLTGAEFRIGREARSEYEESIAPEIADNKTMGMTCLFQTRDCGCPQPFTPPPWAKSFEKCNDLPYGRRGHRWWQMGYWWIELGGENNCIDDTEVLRDELLKIAYGVWDHIKNHCTAKAEAENWALEWIQFLPAKRESRRYVGAHVLTQNDIESQGRFEDIVAYGGWTMDDHHPAGFNATRIGEPATIFHQAPSPYGIPYRSLYSRNIRNLMFAGRDASCTHAAMSSTRVMGTGCSMGQALGTAAAFAAGRNLLPPDVMEHITEIQQILLSDDAYIPSINQEFSELTVNGSLEASCSDPEPVRDGINRPIGKVPHCWSCRSGDHISYMFAQPRRIKLVTAILDSALDHIAVMSYHQKDNQLTHPPDVMPKVFRIEGLVGNNWKVLTRVEQNHHRLWRLQLDEQVSGIRFILEKTWGNAQSRLYAFYVD